MTKRERYERANTRGGLGVRKRMSEESLRTTYRLNGVQTGSVVARAHDRYRGDFTKGFDVGVLLRKTASLVVIHWLGEDEPTPYSSGDARYEVDRGRWKFMGTMQGNPFDLHNPVLDALTELRGRYRVSMSADAGDPAPLTEEPKTEETEESMSDKISNAAAERAKAKQYLASGDAKELATYTAKQIATRCGTDAKTMRKFFRSSHSTVDPVGQGGRYEFDAKDFPKIKREFDAWQKKAKSRATTGDRPKAPTPAAAEQIVDEGGLEVEHDGNAARRKREAVVHTKPPKGFGGIDRYGPNDPDVLPSFEVLPDEPSPEDLAELEDEELDIDDLDAEDD